MDTAGSVKAQLGSLLGSNGLPYWRSLSDFLAGKSSRAEFEQDVRQWINTTELVHLHNSLLMSMIAISHLDASRDSISGTANASRKRKRLLPHQDPPPRLRKWAAGLRKTERERVRNLASQGVDAGNDEIRLERPITLRAEGKYSAGTRPLLQLSSATRQLPNTQYLNERVHLIASQHNLSISRPVVTLASAALEAYLKQLAIDTLSLTAPPHTLVTIPPSDSSLTNVTPSHPATLSLASVIALLNITPSALPTPSAAADGLFLRGSDPDAPDTVRARVQDALDMGADNQLAQYWGLLSRRSGVRDFLDGV